MKIKNKMVVISACVGLILIGSIVVGHLSGVHDGEMSRSRLLLVFPQLMTMQADDKKFIVELSFKCRVSREPVEYGTVVACLRRAAGDGETPGTAVRLEHLLSEQPRTPESPTSPEIA